jgi:hypothetical protein
VTEARTMIKNFDVICARIADELVDLHRTSA